MRHNNKIKTLGRKKAQRTALIRNLAESLVLYGSIRTTKAKAKVLRSAIERAITKASRGTIADRRAVNKLVYTKGAANKLFKELGPKFKSRQGGYTRTTKVGHRPQDGAEMVRIEFVD